MKYTEYRWNASDYMSYINQINHALESAGIPNSRFEAEQIVRQFTMGKRPKGELLSDRQIEDIEDAVSCRLGGEPLQYILGEWEFYSHRIFVGKGVLIPRPETELLVDAVLEHIASSYNKQPEILDIGAGSGCIGIAVAKKVPGAEIDALEKSKAAVKYLKRNVMYHGLKDNINILCRDLAKVPPKSYDIVVSNPPYLNNIDMKNLQKEVRYEPPEALYGGYNGISYYEDIVNLYCDSLKPGGIFAFEIGAGQHEEVAAILIKAGFKDIVVYEDLNDIKRVVVARE
jgi:protein-(glutamine-N5) methyltransferase, release factor-specific